MRERGDEGEEWEEGKEKNTALHEALFGKRESK